MKETTTIFQYIVNSNDKTNETFSFIKTIQALELRKMEYKLSTEDKFTVISVRFEEEE